MVDDWWKVFGIWEEFHDLDCNLGEGDMAHQFIVFFFVGGGVVSFHVLFIGMDGYPVVPQHVFMIDDYRHLSNFTLRTY